MGSELAQLHVGARRTNPYLVALVVGSALVAADDALAYWYGFELSADLSVWPQAFLFLLILWVVEDSRTRSGIYKPFEFGFLVLVFAVPYLPYYLWRTRQIKGLLLLLGFVVLYFLGTLAQLVVYAFALYAVD